MKKTLIIIASILTFIIAIFLLIFVIDVFRFSHHKKPLIVLNTKHYDLEDGSITQYKSILYEFLEVDRLDYKGFEFNFGHTKKFTEESAYRILYDGEMYEDCASHSTLLYENETELYYIECVDMDKMYVLHGEERYNITEALNNKYIKVKDIAKLGFRVVLEQK